MLILLTLSCVLPAQSEEVDFSIDIGLETRGFFADPLLSIQDHEFNASVSVLPAWQWRSADRKHRFNAAIFMRWDQQDDERSHLDVRELYWSYSDRAWTTTVGINKVFWGVTESVHLVDVINQTDLVEDLDQEDKLGQPMLQISRQQNWGRLDLFVLPHFRERTFPGAKGRFGFGVPISDEALYESSAEQSHTDVALRYSHYFGDLDVGLYGFVGTNREPLLLPSDDGSQWQPYYQQMNQLGVDLQYTTDAWLWKLEAIFRDTETDQFWAAVGGFEYTFYQINDGAADLGVLLEYQFDDRDLTSAPTLADNDLFLAARWALNDAKDSSVLGGFSHDLDTGSTFINIEAETRLTDHLTADLRVRLFTNTDPADPAFVFSRNDYVQLGLNWFF
ncbi:hypothetical protein [Marinicella meishanensis]|uniref:hypothetical protein n=1 Tax=Marinicella meishanensis TaxID=2873263 RepID=UPI001CBA74A7|nr:hypothetical protein [Marinicella sp. NBU2979]